MVDIVETLERKRAPALRGPSRHMRSYPGCGMGDIRNVGAREL